jgi:predicted RNase H-like nuclease
VFTPPCRAALAAPDYPAANAAQRAMTGKGLSKQSWMIAPKMREIDAVMTPALQSRVREGHPELALTIASGAPMTAHKTKLHGLFERMRILHDFGLDPAALTTDLPAGIDAAADDLIDACILVHVAARCLRSKAERLPDAPATDARGLVMEMWG